MTDQMISEQAVPVSATSPLDRRTALKAALGGAAAAAVIVGPKIEGFSTAPNYAAASSSGTVTMPSQETGGTRGVTSLGGYYYCWNGAPGNGACATGVRTNTIEILDSKDNEIVANIPLSQSGLMFSPSGVLSYQIIPQGDPNRVVNCTGIITGTCSGDSAPFVVVGSPNVTLSTTEASSTVYCGGSSANLVGTPSVGMEITCDWDTP